MSKTLLKLFTLLLLCCSPSISAGSDLPTLRIAALKFGTVNWELDVIKEHGLDRANGFTLEVQAVAGGPAGKIALQGGQADAIVSDWIWVARQRAAGKDFVFFPYSKSVGALMVPSHSPAQSLTDIVGEKIGIAGGPLDKSWIILRAYAEQQYGLDLAAKTEPVFASAPLIYKSALIGEFGGAINFWHFTAKMAAAGMRPLIQIEEAAQALGLDPETPLLGYVVNGQMMQNSPEIIRGLAKASRQAKALLAKDDTEWDRLRGKMNAANDAEFEALKAGFRSGIPLSNVVSTDAAARVFDLMARLGGRDLVGDAKTLPDGVFVNFAD